MNMLYERLSFRYAYAFLNVFLDKISINDAREIYDIHKSFMQNKKLTFFLEIQSITIEKKVELISKLFSKNKAIEPLKQLLTLLLEQKRGVLFVICLKYIWWLFQERTNTLFFNITSSDQLSRSEQQNIKDFLEHISRKKVVYELNQDKSLIAGIRMQSDQLLWEYSVKKLLRSIDQEFKVRKVDGN